MTTFKKAQWIWVEKNCSPDTYGEFYQTFTWNGEPATIKLSCDSDYTLFINGQFIASGQYGDYEWYKSYDEIDLSPYLIKGENKLAVLVWYFGENFQRYILAPAGLIFEIEQGGQVCVESGTKTLARYSRAYKCGMQKWMTPQLGFSYFYDANKEDEWKNGKLDGFSPAVVVEKNCQFVPRPVKKSVLLEKKQAKLVSQEKYVRVYDLGEETVGLLSLQYTSKTAQKLKITYGEDLCYGKVRGIVGPRDFSVEYFAREGENEYVNHMLRLGCRYLQVESDLPLGEIKLALIPQVYPTKVKPFATKNKRDEEIYRLCVRTLELCMMEHYVDCPWREQCLYAFDSRNQMLCGYYAFEDGNFEYVRANLLLMSKDRYPSGLMSICYPCGVDLTIPSFSLYYTLSVLEYVQHSGDITLAQEVFSRICDYLDAFLMRKKDGLIYRFSGKQNWNFYDWSAHSDGTLGAEDVVIPDAQMNILTVMALRSLKEICRLANLTYPYGNVDEELAQNIYQTFYDKKQGAFSVTAGGEEFVELVNALAVAFDIVSGEDAKRICQKLADGELLPCSLSMKTFKYEALLKVDSEQYKSRILSEIRRDYNVMLCNGATATWETIEGAAAFDYAGSLCHGWTALPVYYFQKLL